MEYKMVENRKISIEDWIELAKEGCAFPVQIYLNGVSMQPLIRRNKDLVTVVPVEEKLQIGDVVLFTDGRRYIVHRIWKISEDGRWVQTWGDNCFGPDRMIEIDKVLGYVVKFERNGKEIHLNTPRARMYGKIWMKLHPVRRVYFGLRKRIGRIYKFIRRGIRND